MCLALWSNLFRKHSLIGLHVNCAAADDVEEQHGPLSGLLGAALHRVKHATNLVMRGKKPVSQMKGLMFLRRANAGFKLNTSQHEQLVPSRVQSYL